MFDMEAIKNFSINKTDWKKVKFGDVVFEPKESVKDPVAEGIEHVVGLEHIDSENIHLRRSTSIEESTTFTKKFTKGDVLFGRRRAYLKKAAQAMFDGICSGDITVMRTKNELLLPELLPFIVNNDDFFDYAITHSAGGLSPRVKFKDLAKYELLIPHIDFQADLVKLMRSMDDVVENEIMLYEIANVQFESIKNSLVLKGGSKEYTFSKKLKLERAKNWNETTLGELIDIGAILAVQDGNHGGIHPKSKDYVDEGIPFIMANVLNNGQINLDKTKKLPISITDKLRIGFSKPGDVLLSHKGTVGEVAIVPNEIQWPYLMLTPQVTYYRVDGTQLLNKFLCYVFTSSYFQNQLKRLSSQSTRAYVGITAQRTLKVVMPNNESEQINIVRTLTQVEDNLRLIAIKVLESKSFQKSLINKVF